MTLVLVKSSYDLHTHRSPVPASTLSGPKLKLLSREPKAPLSSPVWRKESKSKLSSTSALSSEAKLRSKLGCPCLLAPIRWNVKIALLLTSEPSIAPNGALVFGSIAGAAGTGGTAGACGCCAFAGWAAPFFWLLNEFGCIGVIGVEGVGVGGGSVSETGVAPVVVDPFLAGF